MACLIVMQHHVEVLFAVTLQDWEQVAEFSPYHIYTEQTVRERFDWSGKGMSAGSIHLAFVKVSRLEKPWRLEYEKRFGGCDRRGVVRHRGGRDKCDCAHRTVSYAESSICRRKTLLYYFGEEYNDKES